MLDCTCWFGLYLDIVETEMKGVMVLREFLLWILKILPSSAQVTPCETHDKLQHHLHFFRASLINAVFSYMPSPIKKSIVGFYRWQTDYEVYQALLFFQQT